MTCKKSEFKLSDNGFHDTLVIIPGWGFDHRIFERVQLQYNTVIPLSCSPDDFVVKLNEFLDTHSIGNIVMYGWSMGGFLAVDFTAVYPGKVTRLILAGMKEQYDKKDIERIKDQLTKNKDAWLYKFYMNCFSRQEEQECLWFKKNLLKYYTENIGIDMLLNGLDYLSQSALNYAALKNIDTVFIHGTEDMIVPLTEILKIKAKLPRVDYRIIEGAGHVPSFNIP